MKEFASNNNNHKISINEILSFLAIFMIILIPLHTKLASLTLIFFVIFLFCQCFNKLKEANNLSNDLVNLTNNSNISLLERVVMLWLVINVISYTIKLIIQLYHHEFNDVSSFHSRNLIVSIALYLVLVKFKKYENTRIFLKYLPYGIFLIGFTTFIIGYLLWQKVSFGTNQIPWAAGVTILSLTIHILMLQNLHNKWFQIIGWFNSILILSVIFHIGVRGSYFYLVWLGLLVVCILFIIYKKQINIKSILISLFVILVGILFFYIFGLDILNNGISRIIIAIDEIKKFIELGAEGANTSVGARLFMWSESLHFIKENFWFGYGKNGTTELIQSIAMNANSSIIMELNQVHNEYLQSVLSYGVFGLISLLIYPFGLIYIAWLIRYDRPSISFCLLGGVFLFLTAGLTNTNTYHNYFGTTFALAIGIIFMLYLRSIFLKCTYKS